MKKLTTNIVALLTLSQWILLDNLTTSSSLEYVREWDYDVYTGRHFNDLVLPTTSVDNVVKNHAVLIMFAPECITQAMQLKGSIKPWGPKDKYQVIAMHDYVTSPKHVWYDLDEVDNLYERYMRADEDQCLKVMYFKPGSRLTSPILYNPDQKFYDWVWEKMLINIKIGNALNFTIRVKLEGQGDPIFLVDVKSWEIREVSVHISMFITIYDDTDTKLLYYYKMEPHSSWTTIHISDDFLEKFRMTNSLEPGWLLADRETMDVDSHRVHDLHWNMAETHLLTFKQPVLAERFTETGYKIMKIPEKVYEILKRFYDENKDNRIKESPLPGGALNAHINTDEVPTTLVALSDDVKNSVYDALLQLMEEWCQCTLQGTAFYGIREYFKGSILRNHVDRIETHVISSILQIHQDLNGNPDWDLEVIAYNGKRKQIQLKAGEMLLYESATLVHGRPRPFQGKNFANCFLHYKPMTGWNWARKVMDGQHVITNGVIRDLSGAINTPLTLKTDSNINLDNVKTEL